MVELDDHRYIHFKGTLVKRHRWLPIFLFGLECTFRKKLTIALLVGAWLNAIIRSILFILLTQGQMDVDLVKVHGSRFFSKTIIDILTWQLPWLALILASIGAGLIANDLKKGAYQIYFARPITRCDYFLGKFLVSVFYCFMVLWLPIFLLWLNCFLFSGYGNSPNWQQVKGDITGLRFIQTVLYLLITTCSVSLLILMFSSLTKNSKFVALTFISIFLIGKVLEQVGYHIKSLASLQFFSYLQDLSLTGRGFFQLKMGAESDYYIAFACISLLIIACAIILYRRLGKIIFTGEL